MAGYTISGALNEIAEKSSDRIDLSNCELNDDDLERLCFALQDNMHVTYLGLSGNSIGTLGTQYISRMLKKNECLLTLDLNVNEVVDDGALELAHALRENSTLAELFLYGNGISVVGMYPPSN